MAESHEPSYYEIALTNRQVIVAFVILLICLLSAFFSGVWIGRESTARAAAERLVRNAPPPQAPQEGKNLEELEFFGSRSKPADDHSGAAGEAGQTPPSSTDTTLLEDFGGSETGGEAAPPEAPADDRLDAAQGAPAPAPSRAERRRNKKNRQATLAAAAAGGGAAPKTPARPAEPAIPKGSMVIQVFSSADREQADRIRSQLAGGGYKAYLSPIERGGRTMFRVRIGPYASRQDAQRVADKVRTGFKLDTWVTE